MLPPFAPNIFQLFFKEEEENKEKKEKPKKCEYCGGLVHGDYREHLQKCHIDCIAWDDDKKPHVSCDCKIIN